MDRDCCSNLINLYPSYDQISFARSTLGGPPFQPLFGVCFMLFNDFLSLGKLVNCRHCYTLVTTHRQYSQLCGFSIVNMFIRCFQVAIPGSNPFTISVVKE